MTNIKINLIGAISALFSSLTLISQNVDPFTGGLNYNAPLLSVPSDRGNAVPISLMYGGNGINVEQPASEIGLGWSLSAGGSIVRSVNGMPDDLNGWLYSQTSNTLNLQKGCLISGGPTGMDVTSSRRNLDSMQFYFPNYDNYNVSGPGIGGSMTPMILSYMGFLKDAKGELNFEAATSPAFVQPKFVFNGDFSDTLVSRHYPIAPVNSSTPFKMPLDVVSGACYNDATSYYGPKVSISGNPCTENYDPTTRRLATSNYVDYTIAYPFGIISFTITNSAGFIYNYTLPVFTNYSINYTYPITNDYTILDYTSAFVTDPKTTNILNTTSYYKTHSYPNSGGNYVIETKDGNKIAKEWKLTSVKGPDYVDANSNGIVDDADKGYWVVYDYKLWSNNFNSRYPAYGFNYYFGSDPKTENFSFSDPNKRSGKFATATVVNEEIYYLNSIKTSTHKAIFVREPRLDEIGGGANAETGLQDSIKIDQLGGDVSSLHGNMFDEGGTGTYSNYPATSISKTIQLGNVDKVFLNFKEFTLPTSTYSTGPTVNYDKLHIYAGPTTSSPELAFTYTPTGVTYYSPFTNAASIPGTNLEIVLTNYTATAITFQLEKRGVNYSPNTASGFNVEWHATEKFTPQLSLKRILLYSNDFTNGAYFPVTTSITTPTTTPYNRFNLSSTTNTTAPLYNETWYQANLTSLTSSCLKGILLSQNYSLANRYFKNINVEANRFQTRLTSPNNVLQNISVNTYTPGTGKLTLNKIVTTEYQGNQVVPSYKYDYNSSVPADNPDYNPIKVDNWGFYKSDASALGYYGYVTNTSKDFTDAWSLRKITAPYSGITELVYESNTYTKVSDGNGGVRKSARIFPIKTIGTNSNGALTLEMEEGANYTADLSEVYNASGMTTADVFLPINQYTLAFGAVSGPPLINYFGSMNYTFNASLPLPISVNTIAKETNITDISIPIFSVCATSSAFTSSSNYVGLNSTYGYTGNGWLRFEQPLNTLIYGGGNRIKQIISRNGSDAYSTTYKYANGVALNEGDRFTNPKYRFVKRGTCAISGKLESAGGDKFDQAPTIGYKQVKVLNTGQTLTPNGIVEMNFRTSGFYDDDAYMTPSGFNDDNYAVHTSSTNIFTVYGGTCSRADTGIVVEYVDKFSPFWGLMKEQKIFDVNSNMLSKTTWEYESTGQGAIVENFMFVALIAPLSGSGGCASFSSRNRLYETCIKRHYPVVLKRSITYGMSTRTITEPQTRDEITGEVLVTKVVSDNRSSSLSVKVPAFRIPGYAAMGPKSVNASNANILGADAYQYLVTDSTLTVPTGSTSVNFTGASASVFTQTAVVRGYDVTTNTYTTTTNPSWNWYNRQAYGWVGAVGSIDTYGLYKRSELTANPFNYTNTASNSSKWRSAGEITLMDDRSHTLETRSFNNKFSATKLDFNKKYLIAEAGNCNYKSFTYCGFETPIGYPINDGEVNMPASYCSVLNTPGHTGNNVASVTPGGIGPNYSVAYEGTGSNGEELGLLGDRVYRASVWTHTSSPTGANLVIKLDGSVGGTPTTQSVTMNMTDGAAVTIGAWKLLFVELKVPANYTSTGGSVNKLIAYLEVQGSGTAYFDDFIFRPVECSFNAKVQDNETGRVTADINSEGYATKYIYDYAGNLIDTYQEIPGSGLKLIKHKTINYARGNND